MSDLKNEFCWSWSRGKTIRECPRKFYYGSFGSWGGWDSRADPWARKLYILKNSTNVAAWIGSLIHDAVAAIIQTSVADCSQRIAMTLARAEADLVANREECWRTKPKARPLIRDLFARGWEATLADVERAVKTALETYSASEWREQIEGVATRGRGAVLVEELRRFRVDGQTCFAKVDCEVLPGENRTRILIDWKTGKRGIRKQDEDQLLGYALARAPGEEPLLVGFNVVTGDEVKFLATSSDCRKAVNAIRDDMAQIAFFLKDHDCDRNEPLDEEHWPYTEDERTCNWCEFRTACALWRDPEAA
jgi:hypothetical protein